MILYLTFTVYDIANTLLPLHANHRAISAGYRTSELGSNRKRKIWRGEEKNWRKVNAESPRLIVAPDKLKQGRSFAASPLKKATPKKQNLPSPLANVGTAGFSTNCVEL